MLVVEAKREALPPAEAQARFYSANLFVPFYITWQEQTFEIFQLHSFRAPRNLGEYSLKELNPNNLADLIALLSTQSIMEYCVDNEIKHYDLGEKRKNIEALYIKQLQKDLRLAKILDFSKPIDLLQTYIPLYLEELSVGIVAPEDVEEEIQQGAHPVVLENRRRGQTRRSHLLAEIIERFKSTAVVGDPGAGKTTLLKHLCIEHCYSDTFRVPVFIAVRELVATKQTLIEAINRQIGRYGSTPNPETLTEHSLSQGRLLLCVDGLDELDIQDPSQARTVLRSLAAEIADIVGKNVNNIIIISARRESWPTCRPEMPASFKEFEILPLSSSSIRDFVSQWFGDKEQASAESLIDEFRLQRWPEFSSSPLLLALTCIVYEKRGRLPDRPSVLYQRCIDVLLEEWDATRRITRLEKVKGLTPERKFDILAELALSFHTKRRACFSRDEIKVELRKHLPKVGIDPSESGSVFEEITAQHGLIRSWSIEGFFAFPHLVFQEFLAAKALRDRPDGFKVLLKHKYDSFWQQTFKIFASMGDASQLVEELLQAKEDILQSSLFLAADCLSTGAKLSRVALRHVVVERLCQLTKSPVVFLNNRAIDSLASINTSETLNLLESLMKDDNGDLVSSYASRFAVKIYGETFAEEIVNKIITLDYVGDDLIDALYWLPENISISCLENIIATSKYPQSQSRDKDRGIRHRRRRAALLLAKVGQEKAIPILQRLLSLKHLTDFEKSGIVDALAVIQHPSLPQLFNNIVHSAAYPTDCKISAAGHLGPDNLAAKNYLLSLTADSNADCYDRRDAASKLCNFNLDDEDIPPVEYLAVDKNYGFFGGPVFAAEAISCIGSQASKTSLQRVFSHWKNLDGADRDRIVARIELCLALNDPVSDLENLVVHYLKPNERDSMSWEFPELFQEFYKRKPDRASKILLTSIIKHTESATLGDTLNWVVSKVVLNIALTPDLLNAIVKLATKIPDDESIWVTLYQLWKRRDLDENAREAFSQSSPIPSSKCKEQC